MSAKREMVRPKMKPGRSEDAICLYEEGTLSSLPAERAVGLGGLYFMRGPGACAHSTDPDHQFRVGGGKGHPGRRDDLYYPDCLPPRVVVSIFG